MNTENSLNHTKWGCKYHIAWIPKYRKKSLYKDLRQYLGATLGCRNARYIEAILFPFFGFQFH